MLILAYDGQALRVLLQQRRVQPALYPSYMANTQSSRAKARSHSTPKQRPGSFERAPGGRRPSVDGKNAAGGLQKTRPTKLDRSRVSSLQESEFGSSNTTYCSKSLIAPNFRRQGFLLLGPAPSPTFAELP